MSATARLVRAGIPSLATGLAVVAWSWLHDDPITWAPAIAIAAVLFFLLFALSSNP